VSTLEHPTFFAGLDEIEANFARILKELGMHRALGFLNLRTWHRYTGVYRFHHGQLRCVSLFDRENLGVKGAPDEQLTSTLASIVARFSTSFATPDSLDDPRLGDHGARSHVRAFHAVPLTNVAERCFGALVHWDTEPQTLSQREMRLLFMVAPHVSRALLEKERPRITSRLVRERDAVFWKPSAPPSAS
jgi:hypothetical protein